MKILITGGHLTPALAVIDYLQAHHPEVAIVFVGRLFSQVKLQQSAVEAAEIAARKIKFIPFEAVKLDQGLAISKIFQLPQLIKSVWQARQLIKQERPTIMLSFGGYLAVPLAFACFLAHIPVVTHEQTRSMGIANRLIAIFSQAVAISFPETAAIPASAKTILTGNPLRAALLAPPPPPPIWAGDLLTPAQQTKPLLIVLGGNQGSATLNQLIGQCLPALLTNWRVVQQTGKPTLAANFKASLEQQVASYEPELKKAYVAREWITQTELTWLYHQAQIAISRAGANTVLELAAMKLPAILIPLPFAHGQEQLKNAQWLEQAGGAVILPQDQLTPSRLLATLEELRPKLAKFKQQLVSLPVDTQASEKLYQVLLKVEHESRP